MWAGDSVCVCVREYGGGGGMDMTHTNMYIWLTSEGSCVAMEIPVVDQSDEAAVITSYSP